MDASPLPPTLIILSDTICPWCFIGKRKIEAALSELGHSGLHFDVEWRPYQLNPDMPDDGMDRRRYRADRFGSSHHSDELDRCVTDVGREVGIDFHYERVLRTPNTLASHVMVADALRAGGYALQNRAVEALFQAYFVEGRDVGRDAVLREIAREVGFDHGPSVSAHLWELVESQDQEARSAGLGGVPSVLLNDRVLFSGAQPTSAIVKALRQVVAPPAVLRLTSRVMASSPPTC
jgi:predicted DsbA family dithiol-disulfide isomerase